MPDWYKKQGVSMKDVEPMKRTFVPVMMAKKPKKDRSRKEDVQLLERIRTKKPKLYRVLIHNDDYTTQEFVIYALAKFFRKDATEAYHIMLEAHTKGMATVGVYTKDVAETRVSLVEQFSEEHGHPLKLTIEPE